MRDMFVRLTLLAVVAALLTAFPVHAADWEKIGHTTVVYNDEEATIKVKKDMVCSQLKLGVRGKWVELRSATLHFADGTAQAVELNEQVEPGMESEPIEIEGEARALEKVVLSYAPVDGRWSGRTNLTLMGQS